MKKTLLILTLFIYTFSNAQIVNIPDANFKYALLNHNPIIDINGDNEIQVSEAEIITSLDVEYRSISDLTGIESFINLTVLDCYFNQLTNLDLSNNTSLTYLYCDSNQLTNLDVSNNINLTYLYCESNQLTNLNILNNINLKGLFCKNNLLSTIDSSNNTSLTGLDCSFNHLTNLDLSNNTSLKDLNCESNQITNLNVLNNINLTELLCNNNYLTNLNVSNNTSLKILYCNNNQLTNLDISNNTSLKDLNCNYNQLTNLDTSNNTSLIDLNCSYNQLINLDVSNNIGLRYLTCSNNEFTTLDLSSNPLVSEFQCNESPNLTYLNLKNGVNDHIHIFFNMLNNNPVLQTICVDDINSDFTSYILNIVGHPVTFTEYCSLTPALSNQIIGTIKIDVNNNGCDSNDLPLSNTLIISDNGVENFSSTTQNNGLYQIYTNEGDFTTTVNLNLPSYWSTTPANYTNNFTDFNNTFTADFCVTPNQTINDVNISLLPISDARPGFNVKYQIVYTNVGTTQLSGNVTLDFDDSKLSFLNASETVATQTSNSLIFNYTNLNPFETRTIDLVFNVFTPPTVNIDDVLNFTSTINPTIDNTPDDNVFILNQTVIGSYDPNDLSCLEGNKILDTNTDKYLHYVIRFQNTGTASAINVVVKNELDNQLDWNTFQLQSTSHLTRVAIKNGNKIEFIFEDIQLPDSTTDEPNSHGFIAYKIKPKNTVGLGDIIPNKADIFFDYNEAVETNTANVEVVNTLTVHNNSMLYFSVYPIPTTDILSINSKSKISKIEIYSKLGKLVLQNTTNNKIDISNLNQGFYFVKVKDKNGNFGLKKVIKN